MHDLFNDSYRRYTYSSGEMYAAVMHQFTTTLSLLRLVHINFPKIKDKDCTHCHLMKWGGYRVNVVIARVVIACIPSWERLTINVIASSDIFLPLCYVYCHWMFMKIWHHFCWHNSYWYEFNRCFVSEENIMLCCNGQDVLLLCSTKFSSYKATSMHKW